MELKPAKEQRITVNVKKFESTGRGRYRVKIVETHANLINMTHNGEKYVVVKNLGRGRYIVRKEDGDEK